jgi:hypothetical protein
VTTYDRAEVIRELADLRRECADLKREWAMYCGWREGWRVKAVAATVAGDEEEAELCTAFAEETAEDAAEIARERASVIGEIRKLERMLTYG